MAEFSVEIAGTDRTHMAQDLHDSLRAQHGQAQVFTETERALDPLTVVSVVLSAVQAADIVWKWWQGRRSSSHTVTIRTASGRVIELANVTQHDLERLLADDE